MSEAEFVAGLAAKAAGVQTMQTDDGREFLVVPDGFTHHEVADARKDSHGLTIEKPLYVKQNVTLQTVDSLTEYVNRFKGASTMLFADIASNTIAGLIDYHQAAGDGVSKAEHVAHISSMVLPCSEEWRAWSAIHGKLMGQLEFARFIEENAVDVIAPTGAELLEVVHDLQAHRKVNFTKAVRTASDNENFEFSSETTAGTKRGDVEIPTKFLLKIPVYFGEPPTELFAFLRWRLEEPALSLGVVLHRAEYVRQAVFQQIVLSVSERTQCPAVFGKAK